HAEKALQVSPRDPLIYHATFALALACLLAGRAEEAATNAQRAIEGNAQLAFAYCVLAVASVRLDRRREARDALVRLARVAASFRIGTLRRVRFADAARLQADLD